MGIDNHDNRLVTLEHIRQLAQRIVDELDSLKNIDERLQNIEGITGIDCGEIVANND